MKHDRRKLPSELIAIRYQSMLELTIGFYLWILFRMYIGVSITKSVRGKREKIGPPPLTLGAGLASLSFQLEL